MITNLKPYPAYKDSGVEWLGEVPTHWEVRRLGSMTQILNGATPSSSMPEYWDGDIVWVTPDDLGKMKGRYIDDSLRRITREGYNASGTTLAPAGSIVVSTRAPIGHLGILRVAACANQGCRLLVPQAATSSEYLYHVLVAARPSLEVLGQGSTFLELSRSNLRAFPIPFPPLPEQTAIVRFLDYIDRRIRRYIRAKQKLIKLLEEYKQALIHRAVTGQIDVRTGQPYPAYKPSGVEWLGQVPEHWEVARLKSVVMNVVRQTAERRDGEMYVALEHVEGWTGRIRQADVDVVFDSQVKRFKAGDILFGKLRPYLAKVTLPPSEGVCVAEFLVLRPRNDSAVAPYMGHLLRSKSVIDAISGSTFGAKMPRADWGFIGAMLVTLPPLPEQNAIVEYLDAQTAKIDTAIATSHREIELLREYRTRLIADVVTGKVDVREVAARLPEELSEEEAESMDADEIAEDEATDEEAGTETVEEEEVEP